jgi:hypothetical protein
MKRIPAHIAKLPLLIMLFIAFLSSSVAVHYVADTPSVVTVEVEKNKADKLPVSDLVIKQASFEAVIPFVHHFIPQNFYNFHIEKVVVLQDVLCIKPQTVLSIPVFLRNIFSNIIASNAP